MRHVQTQALLNHWRDLSRKGAPPDRNDLDPGAIASALQDIFILGCGPDGLWRYRVAGTRLSARADRDLRGELFTGWWRAQDRFDIARLLAGLAEDRTPVVGGVCGLSTRQGRHDLEFILLPLRHGGLDGQRMLGGLFPNPSRPLASVSGTAAHAGAEQPRSFDIRFDELSILSLRSLTAPADGQDAFGRPRKDLDQLVERRHGLRVITGGLS